MRGATSRAGGSGAEDTEHDRPHGEVLAPSSVLVEHTLAEEQQHEQANGHCWLHDHERHQQQRHHLQGPAEHRKSSPR